MSMPIVARDLSRKAVALSLCLTLAGCGQGGGQPEDGADGQGGTVIETVSLTQESEEEVAGRSRDVTVIASRDAVLTSIDAVRRIADERGFADVHFLVEGASDADDGSAARDGSSAMEIVGWWVDGHDRVWALHFVSGGLFASRVWLDETDESNMVVCESDRVTMYNADFKRLVKVGVSELEREGVQVVSVERVDAATLGEVEVSHP